MFLFINSCRNNEITITIFSKDGKIKKTVKSDIAHKKSLALNEIEKLLRSQKVDIKKIEGIVCSRGQGNFSSVRAGVSIANAFAWFLHIPIAEVFDTDVPSDKKDMENFLQNSIAQGKVGRIIEPWYGKEPNITMKVPGIPPYRRAGGRQVMD